MNKKEFCRIKDRVGGNNALMKICRRAFGSGLKNRQNGRDAFSLMFVFRPFFYFFFKKIQVLPAWRRD